MIPRCDLHVHAAPSLTPRWGNDLDLIHAAHRHGVRLIVLKSHHEQTASRAAIASDYARRAQVDCRVVGSIVLNPWIALVELERALSFGARIVWWPTLDADGRATKLELPAIHDEALSLISSRSDVVVATGHLTAGLCEQLVRECLDHRIRVIATHPLNPDFGVGVEAGIALMALGAHVEVDACSLATLRAAGLDPVARVRRLLSDDARAFASSDGGAAEYGEPFAFLARELRYLRDNGAEAEANLLIDGAGEWLDALGPQPQTTAAPSGVVARGGPSEA